MKGIFPLITSYFLLICLCFIVNKASANNRNDSLISLANENAFAGNDFLFNKNYKQAEILYEKSIVYWDSVSIYHEYNSFPYYQLGDLYSTIGNNKLSILHYNIAEKILLKASLEQMYILGALYANIGLFYIKYGDYQKSINYYDRAIEILEPIKEDNKYEYSIALSGKAQVYYYLEQYDEAIKIVKSYLEENENQNDLIFNKLIAKCLINLSNYDEAIKILINLSIKLKSDHDEYPEILLILADAYLKNNNLLETKKSLEETFPLLNGLKSDNDPWMIYYYEIYGQYLMAKANKENSTYIKLGDYTEAINVFDKALLLNSHSNNNKIPYLEGDGEFISPIQVKDVLINRTNVLTSIGEIYENQQDQFTSYNFLERALKTSDATIRFLHDLRISFLEEESKLSLTEQHNSVYHDGFAIASDLFIKTGLSKYFEKMLEFSESGKSATFMASMNDVKAKSFGGIPDSLIQNERELNMQLSSLRQLLFNERNSQSPDSSLISEWEKSIFSLETEHDEMIFFFEREYPEFYDFKYKNSTIPSSKIIENLNRHQALIEYFVDEPSSISDSGSVSALVFTSSGYTFHNVKIGYEYITNLEKVIKGLTKGNIGDTNIEDFRNYTSSAKSLYEILIESINLNSKIDDLIIIPDGKLAYIPFDALLTDDEIPDRLDFRRLNYLVYDYKITYSYSATLHFDYFKRTKQRGRDLLAFAPEYKNYEIDLNKNAYRNRQVERSILRPLPGAKEEVLKLSKFKNCIALFNEDASEKNFKLKAENFDVLHLAMHTIMNDSIPMFSKLVFSNTSDTIEDGYLNTQEIYNMKLKARLAVLSACNSGSGKMRTGEGVMSMSRAFLYAGCPSIVMTLWEVEDKVSAVLMMNFYKYLFKGYSKSDALWKAKLEHIKNADPLKAHPYFWLGYILVGDPSPIKMNDNILISIIIFSSLVIILFLLGKYRIKGRKRL